MVAAAGEGFRPLDEGLLVEYIRATPALREVLGGRVGDGELTIKEVGDGNLNFVYIVLSPAGSVVIKQVLGAPPFSPLLPLSVLSLITFLQLSSLPRFSL